MKKWVLIDGNALVHRSFHAVPRTLHTPDGRLSNAVYGFMSMLLGIFEAEKPNFLVVAFDRKGPTFRDDLYKEYKATRAKTDDELIPQFPLVRQGLESLGIPIYEKDGLEADDFLSILSTELTSGEQDNHVVIVTGDKDALQLVDDNVTVVTPISGYTKVKRYNRAEVKAKMGVWPEQVPDYKGLAGDPSDNLPGVPGVGDKTAAMLLEQFGTVEEIYENLEKIESGKLREKLVEHEKQARLCKHLATLVREDGITVDREAASTDSLTIEGGLAFFENMGFRSLLPRLYRMEKDLKGHIVSAQQESLF